MISNEETPDVLVPFAGIDDGPATRPGPRIWPLVKPVFDRLFALTVLVCIAPVLVLIAIAIKLDSPGPVLFRQHRFGRHRRIIPVTKFRTMRHDLTDHGGRQQALRGDARVTRLGAVLRRTCLDELPQFWDVLAGRLSVVGPRPHPLKMEVEGIPAELAIANYHARHEVRPGITGLAQVRGNSGPVETIAKGRDRIAHDIEYARRQSLWLDLQIIARTFHVLLVQRSNY